MYCTRSYSKLKEQDENKKIEPDRKCVVWSVLDSAIWGCRLRKAEILVGCDGCLILNRQFAYAENGEWNQNVCMPDWTATFGPLKRSMAASIHCTAFFLFLISEIILYFSK